MIDVLYNRFLRHLMLRFDAETAHRMTLKLLAAWPFAHIPAADPPELRVRLWDVDFPNPVGLAAGMDKDAVAVAAWQSLGFGFAELGTITPRPQPGNPRPRIFRLPEHRALINRLGFPSDGMDVVAPRIERMRRRGIRLRVGLNFGPNKDTPADRVAGDYRALMERLGAMADFVVINVSSPNTPGLREWQSPERMKQIFAAIADAIPPSARRPPILIKVAPDLVESDLIPICDAALEAGAGGIVATNTTLKRAEVGVASAYEGGLSGEPLRESARAIIRQIFRHVGRRLPIIGVGGIASADDAWGHIRAGASLVELYTGLIYAGPGLPAAIKAGLAGLLRRDGFSSINDAVGTES
ncbi:MAG TPA: quinone-dependent dihydroorotate dehydrogenase [Candidatus Binataceae bacterium]|nr:quinone-dependent dihydroorotate dehydrogenase [Candidatus Binataceae bacterium]